MRIIFPVLVWRRQFFDPQIVREGTICRYPVSDNLHATFDEYERLPSVSIHIYDRIA
jgi:hypothetical protein